MADPEAASAIRVAGKYSADQFGISALFQTVSNAAGIKDLSQQTIGGEVMFHASPEYDIKGGYYMADPNTDVDNDDYALATFGVDRNYGKDVTVYIQFAMIMNGDDAAMGLGGNGWGDSVPTFAAGESPYSVSLGLWKKF
ncbi:MAG: porin [Candidatus Krumholzibacteriia bacterium]